MDDSVGLRVYREKSKFGEKDQINFVYVKFVVFEDYIRDVQIVGIIVSKFYREGLGGRWSLGSYLFE